MKPNQRPRPDSQPLQVYRNEAQAIEYAKAAARGEGVNAYVLAGTHDEAKHLGSQPVLLHDWRITGRQPLVGPYIQVKPGGAVERFDRESN